MLVTAALCSFITCPSLTGDRVTDHATDTNQSVIRHNYQSRPGIADDDRQGHSVIPTSCNVSLGSLLVNVPEATATRVLIDEGMGM